MHTRVGTLLLTMDARARRGVLDHEAERGDAVADGVRDAPVLLCAGRLARGEQGLRSLRGRLALIAGMLARELDEALGQVVVA